MSILVLLIAIGLTWKFLPRVFEFIIGMFIVHLIWQVIKLIFKFALVSTLILLALYWLIK